MKTSNILRGFMWVLIGLTFMHCQKDEKPNSSPVIQSVTVTPNTVNANGMVTIQVVATDADNDLLQYSYIVTGGAITGSGPNVTWTAPSAHGANSVTVTVSDGKGGVATSNASLTVQKPVTQITGTASFIAGVSGNLENAKVSIFTSLENFELNQPVKWTAVNGSGGSVTFALTDIIPGNYYLLVWKDNNNSTIIDNGDYVGIYGKVNLGSWNLTEIQLAEGETFTCAIEMWILNLNSDPVITSVNVNPGVVFTGQRANVQVNAYDDDNDPLTYTYSVTGGSIIGAGSNVQWEAPQTPGEYTLRVYVSDGEGGEDDAQATLKVEASQVQTKITGTAKMAVGVNADLSNAKVSIYKNMDDWFANNPAKFTAAYGSGASVTYTLNNVPPGTYFLDVWKDMDNDGNWSAGDLVGVHGNSQGLIPITITEGQTLVINVEVNIL